MRASCCLRAIECQVAQEPPHVSEAEAGPKQMSAEPDRGGTEDEAQEEGNSGGHSLWDPPDRSLSGGRPVTVGQDLERKIKDKGGDGKGTQELIVLGVLPWQPPESSNLQGWEDKLDRQSLRSSSTPLGLRNYRVALAPSPARASRAKNWRPGGRSLARSSQWPGPASPGMPCRTDAPFRPPAVSLSHPRDTGNLTPAALHRFLWTDCLGTGFLQA